MCIDPLPLLDEQGGQEPPLAIPRHVGHQGLGHSIRSSPQCGQDQTQALVHHVLFLEHREQLGARLVDLQKEGHEIALEGNRRRPGIGVGGARRAGHRLGASSPGPGALQLLGLDPELGRVHAEPAGRLAGQRGRLLGIGHLGEDQGNAGVGVGAAAGGGQVFLAERLLEHEREQRTRRVEHGIERGGPLGAEQAVRVVAGRKERHPDRQVSRLLEAPGARDGPAQVLQVHHVVHHLLEPARGLLSSGVGVEEGHHLVGVATQQPELGGGEGGAERGHRLAEAVLMGHEAVEVALDEDGPAPVADRSLGDVEGVEHLALDVERGLRGVEVLRLLARQRAPAEGHHAALHVADREEQAATEAVVEAGLVLAGQDEPGLHQDVVRDPLPAHDREQRVPALGRVAQAEALAHLGVHPTLLEIGARLLAAALPQRGGVELGRERHHAPQRFELAVHLGCPRARVGQGHPGALGERAHRLREGDAVLAHQEAEGVAARAAAEAVVDVALRVDRERRGLLGVEGAEPLPVLARALELHHLADDLEDVDAGADLVEVLLGESARHGVRPQPWARVATVAPPPPSEAAPGRCSTIRGWPPSTSSTARRSAPVPLPWMMRTVGSPARKASSRYFSSRSRASSVVRPMRCSSPGTPLLPGTATTPRDPAFALRPVPIRGREYMTPSPGATAPRPPSPRATTVSACIGTFTVTAPACTVAVSPSTASTWPLSPRCETSTRSPGVAAPEIAGSGAAAPTVCSTHCAVSTRRLRARSSSERLFSVRFRRSHSSFTCRRTSVTNRWASAFARATASRAVARAASSSAWARASRPALSASRRSSAAVRSASRRSRSSRRASSSWTAWASAAPSSGSVPAPSSSSSTRERPSTRSSTSRSCLTNAENVERFSATLWSSPTMAKTWEKTGRRAPARAGTWQPACAIRASRPRVLSATVLPPALGPVMTSSGRSAWTSMSIGMTCIVDPLGSPSAAPRPAIDPLGSPSAAPPVHPWARSRGLRAPGR